MKAPKVELKNVKTFEGHDGLGLNADVWINGINCMHLFDGAYGGEYEYTMNTYNNPKADQVRTNVQLLDDYIATLPEETSTFGDRTFKLKMDRDMFLNNIYEQMQLEKQMKKAILVGEPNGTSYQKFSWKGKTLAQMPVQALQMTVDNIKKKYCTGNVRILNTNLQKLGVTI